VLPEREPHERKEVSVTVSPTYSGCTAAPGGLETVVVVPKCTYTLTVPNVAASALTGAVTNCPEETGKHITIIITSPPGTVLCEYTVSNQSGLTGSTWTNRAGSPEDITLEITVAPKAVVDFGPKITCGAAAGGTMPIVLKGKSTVRAFKDESGKEGAQIGVMIG
jgi:hypothetical protein